MESLNFTHGSGTSNHTQGSIALPILMFAGGAIGNLVAIIVLSLSRTRGRSSAFYTLVCGLAVTDLLGTCLASPLTIANYVVEQVLQNQHACQFHSFLLLFFGLTGLSIIFSMAAERFLAICCPYTYRRWSVDRRSAQKVLLFIYVSHSFLCCLPVMGLSGSRLQRSETWCFIDWRTSFCALYGVLSLLLILLTMALNLAVCGTLLLMRRKVVRRPGTRTSVRQRWRSLSSAAETQMMAVLVLTSAVVVACSAPLVVRVFANCFMQRNDATADLAAIRIASVNPILDPWIYILLRRSQFRRLLSLPRIASRTRNSSLLSTQTHLFCPDNIKDEHVFAQLMFNANIVTQLPATSAVRNFQIPLFPSFPAALLPCLQTFQSPSLRGANKLTLVRQQHQSNLTCSVKSILLQRFSRSMCHTSAAAATTTQCHLQQPTRRLLRAHEQHMHYRALV
uniref:Prostaglandin E2 receptor EP4 subtype-like n=1 Tax=Gouania willdenowi TaxID=441366 RepID=A0A8C5DF52_GOUWI